MLLEDKTFNNKYQIKVKCVFALDFARLSQA